MRGHIRQRGKGTWAVVVSLGRDPLTGKRRQRWETVKGTKRDAERRLTELLRQQDGGAVATPGRMTTGEFLRRWLQDYAATNVRPRTYVDYARIVSGSLIPALGRIPLTRLQPADIQRYHSMLLATGRKNGKGGVSARTVVSRHRVLSEALSHAVKWGLLLRNPAQAVDPPRATAKPVQTLDADGVHAILAAAAGTPYRAVFHLAVTTGLRRSELLALKWKRVDLDLATLQVVEVLHKLPGVGFVTAEPKSAKGRRSVALPPSAVIALREHRAEQEAVRAMLGGTLHDDDLVFSTPDGQPMPPDEITRRFTVLARAVGLSGVTFHSLRHTHATMMLQQGVHPKIVQERLGHSTISITLDTYSHVTPGLQEAAAARFDEALALPADTENTEGFADGLQNVPLAGSNRGENGGRELSSG